MRCRHGIQHSSRHANIAPHPCERTCEDDEDPIARLEGAHTTCWPFRRLKVTTRVFQSESIEQVRGGRLYFAVPSH